MADRLTNQKRYWNMMASRYDTKFGYQTKHGREKLESKVNRIVEILGLEKGQRVLEIGCGTGIYTEMLAKRGLVMTGLDISEGMLRLAMFRRLLDYRLGDIHHLPFEANAFDAVVGFYVLIYADVLQVLSEAQRVLKPNGKVGFIELNAYNPIVFAKTKVKFAKNLLSISNEASSFSRKSWSSQFKKQFTNVETDYMEYGFLKPISQFPLVKPIAGSILIKGVKA
jgi:ubiquinone/menaquinone biosynthesis C-methylase UbiE